MKTKVFILYIYGDPRKPSDKRDVVGIFTASKIRSAIIRHRKELGLKVILDSQSNPTKYNDYMSLGLVEDYELNAIHHLQDDGGRLDPWDW